MALSDDEVEQIAKQVEDRQKTERRVSPLKGLSTNQKLMIGLAIAAVIYFFFLKSTDMPTWQKMLIVVGTAAGIIMFSSYGEDAARLLTDRELVTMLYDQLKWYQDHHFGGEYLIKQGTIKIDLESTPEWRDGKILFQRRRVWIRPTGEQAIEYETRQDPYIGDLRGCIEVKAGFSGRDAIPKETLYSRDFWRDMMAESEKKKWTKK
jgi:hypothetical protein